MAKAKIEQKILNQLQAVLPRISVRLEARRLVQLAKQLAQAKLFSQRNDLVEALVHEGKKQLETVSHQHWHDVPPNVRFEFFAKLHLIFRCMVELSRKELDLEVVDHSLIRFVKSTLRYSETSKHKTEALEIIRLRFFCFPDKTLCPLYNDELKTLCQKWASNSDASLWTILKAILLLKEVWPLDVLPILDFHLNKNPIFRNHFLLRAMIFRFVFRDGFEPDLLKKHYHQIDSSEVVRQHLSEALLIYASHAKCQNEVRPPLKRTLDPKYESSEKVRAWAARALVKHLVKNKEPFYFELFILVLKDTNPLVLKIAIDTLRVQVLSHLLKSDFKALSESQIIKLIQRLYELKLSSDTSLTLQSLLSNTIEIFRVIIQPDQREQLLHIYQYTRNLRELKKLRLPLTDSIKADDIGRVLAVLSQDDMSLYASLSNNNQLDIYRGEIYRTSLWRILFEIRNFRPDKRRDVVHTIGFKPIGNIRAHSEKISSPVITNFVGDRLYVEREGGWGRYLPLPEDVISLGIKKSSPIQLFSSHGITTIDAPSSWTARAYCHTYSLWHFQKLWKLRQFCLKTDVEQERSLYIKKLEHLGLKVRFLPYIQSLDEQQTILEDPKILNLFKNYAQSVSSAGMVLFLPNSGTLENYLDFLPALSDIWSYAILPVGNDIGQLAIGIGCLASFLLFVSAFSQWKVETHRSRIPLTIGGWGTRGKSSVERLKAAMFSGLGYEVLCKTTGSTPSLLYAPPWGESVEIPIYRPGDRSTIWEQKEVLHIAARLGVQVFLWECMAIRPDFTEILQNHWMRDKISTLTNAFPDHEEQQGPGSIDVARSLCQIMSRDSMVITTEDTMLPILKEEALKKHTQVLSTDPYEDEIISDELVSLFPHLEHKKNIVLLQSLAKHLGFDPYEALSVTAQNIKPDIGVLRRVKAVTLATHKLVFVNGMAANDEASTLDNLKRLQRRHHELTVIVANTRKDRPLRTEIFARLLAKDIPAVARVFTGTDAKTLEKLFLRECAKRLDKLAQYYHYQMSPIINTFCNFVQLFNPDASGLRQDLKAALKNLANFSNQALAEYSLNNHWDQVEQWAQQCLKEATQANAKEARLFCQNHIATTSFSAMLNDMSLESQKILLRTWLDAMVKRILLNTLLRKSLKQVDSELNWHPVKEIFLDYLRLTSMVAEPDANRVIVSVIKIAPPGELLVYATMNIGGMGRPMLADFSTSEDQINTYRQYTQDKNSILPTQLIRDYDKLQAKGLATTATLGKIAVLSQHGPEPFQNALCDIFYRSREKIWQSIFHRPNLFQYLLQYLLKPFTSSFAILATIPHRWQTRRIMRRFAKKKLSPRATQQKMENIILKESL